MGYQVDHRISVKLNRQKLDGLIFSYKDIHSRLVERGIALGYKGFMNMVEGRTQWSLLYAYVLASELGKSIEDIFYIESMDVQI